MNKKIIVFLLVLFTFISAGLHLYKNDAVPGCINADEAAFGYNAYSLLKTGKDEYGSFLPLRLKSFGDNKLPLYSYLAIPFIAVFGLNEFVTRLPSYIFGSLFPLVIFFLARELFKNSKAALISSFLVSVSPWIITISRQAHEATIAAFFISLSALFYLRFIKTNLTRDSVLFSFSVFLSLFSYHISKTLSLLLVFLFLFHLLRERKSIKKYVLFIHISLLVIALVIFTYSEVRYPATRIQNLIFFRNQGFSLKLDELNREHYVPLFHNSVTASLTQLVKQYSAYFSPEFLFINGDPNPRFGYPDMSLITIAEYAFLFVGLYLLFKRKLPHRWFLMLLLLIAPLSAALAWQDLSLTRSFFLIVPLTLVAAYGAASLRSTFYQGAVVVIFLFFISVAWDFYFFHYFKRPLVIRSFQCGYKELSRYVKDNYDRFAEFRITQRHGQPYIFLLYYLHYDPTTYQHDAQLSAPDQYGFGQVEGFDKFNFNFAIDTPQRGISYIGYPEHFINNPHIDIKKIKKIIVGGEEIFWIYES